MIFANIEFNSDIDFKHEYLVQTDDGKINLFSNIQQILIIGLML